MKHKRKIERLRKISTDITPVQYYNSILGIWVDYSIFREFKKESTRPAEKLKN